MSREIAAYGGTDLLFRGAQFLVLPIYAHELRVSDFGLLALIQVSATLLGMLLNLGVNNAVQRFYFDPEIATVSRPSVVSTGLAQLLISAGLGVAGSFVLVHSLRQGIENSYGVPWLLLSLALLTVLPEQIAQYTLDAVRLQFAPARFVAISVVKNALGIVIGLWFLLNEGMGVAGILFGALIAAVLAVPLGLWMIRPNLTLAIDPRITGRIFRFGFPYVLAGAAYWVFGSIDRWMLAEYSDLQQVGLFSVAFKFAAVLTVVIAAFGQAWSPFAYKLSAEDSDYRRLFAQILSGWFFLLTMLAFVLSLFARELVELLTPEPYWAASPMLAIGVCGVALYGTTLISAMGISLEKKTMLLTAAAWLAAAVNVGINLMLIPRFGGLGAAISTLASYAVLTGATLYWSQKYHPLELEWRKLGYSVLLLCVALVSVAVAHDRSSVAGIAIKLLLCVSALMGAIWAGILTPRVYQDLRRQFGGI